jgi:hypothetical protein
MVWAARIVQRAACLVLQTALLCLGIDVMEYGSSIVHVRDHAVDAADDHGATAPCRLIEEQHLSFHRVKNPPSKFGELSAPPSANMRANENGNTLVN